MYIALISVSSSVAINLYIISLMKSRFGENIFGGDLLGLIKLVRSFHYPNFSTRNNEFS